MSGKPPPELVDGLQRHQLLSADQIRQVAESGDDISTAELFTSWLVQRGWLTAFQGQYLQEGKLERLVLGGYRLLDPIGVGGMGEVFRARQLNLDRVVAVKLIRADFASERAEALARFRREALAVARLSHPNIAHIYDADEYNGTHYIAMQYVHGPNLSQLVNECGPLPVRVACDYIRQAALGLQHAHEHGLVHRDVKRSNLIVALPQGPPVAARDSVNFGVLKLLDLGLARINEDTTETGLTRERGVLGTPDYMSPEQARDPRRADIRSDLYSLGCTFHFLLVGQPPFPQGTSIEKVLQHQLERPTAINKLRPGVAPEALTILAKFMRKDPRERYQTPAEAAGQLTLFLNMRNTESFVWPPVPRSADPTGSAPATHAHPTWFNGPVELGKGAQAPQAVPPAPETVRIRLPEPEAPRLSELVEGTHLSDVDDKPLPRTDQLPAYVAPSGPEPDPLPPTCRVVKGATVPDLQATANSTMFALPAYRATVLQGHTAPVVEMAFDARGRHLATGGLDYSVRVWRLDGEDTRQQTAFLDRRLGEIRAITFNPHSAELLISATGLGGRIWVWRWQNETSQDMCRLEKSIGAADLSITADGKHIAGVEGNQVFLWSSATATGKLRGTLVGRGRELTSVAFSADGQRLFAGDVHGAVLSWRGGWRRLRQSEMFAAHNGPVNCLTVSRDDRFLATASTDNFVRIWSKIAQVQLAVEISAGLRGVVCGLHFSPDGESLTTISNAGQAARWRTSNGQKELDWDLNQPVSSCLLLSQQGNVVAQGRTDGSVHLYKLPNATSDSSADQASKIQVRVDEVSPLPR